MTKKPTYQVEHDALQNFVSQLTSPGAMPAIQRDWILSWINSNITPVSDESENTEPASDDSSG